MAETAIQTRSVPAAEVPDAAAFRRIVMRRKSVRAYLPEPLPDARIRSLLELAQWAPSNCNTQPWVAHVVSGGALERLREELLAGAAAGMSPDISYNAHEYPPQMHGRMVDHVMTQQLAFGIAREDATARDKLRTNNLRFFGAPHVLLLYLPAFANEREAADLGMFAQTFMLALESEGLAGVPQTSIGVYAATVRRVAQPTEGLRLMFAISFGREDTSHAAVRLEQVRAGVGDFAILHS